MKMIQGTREEMIPIVNSAISLWGFMANDLSVPKAEREAAKVRREYARKVVRAARAVEATV